VRYKTAKTSYNESAMNKRNTYTPEFKIRVAYILKEAQTISRVAQKYQVHLNMLTIGSRNFLNIH